MDIFQSDMQHHQKHSGANPNENSENTRGGCWFAIRLDTEKPTLCTEKSILGTEQSKLCTEKSILGIEKSKLGTEKTVSEKQYPVRYSHQEVIRYKHRKKHQDINNETKNSRDNYENGRIVQEDCLTASRSEPNLQSIAFSGVSQRAKSKKYTRTINSQFLANTDKHVTKFPKHESLMKCSGYLTPTKQSPIKREPPVQLSASVLPTCASENESKVDDSPNPILPDNSRKLAGKKHPKSAAHTNDSSPILRNGYTRVNQSLNSSHSPLRGSQASLGLSSKSETSFADDSLTTADIYQFNLENSRNVSRDLPKTNRRGKSVSARTVTLGLDKMIRSSKTATERDISTQLHMQRTPAQNVPTLPIIAHSTNDLSQTAHLIKTFRQMDMDKTILSKKSSSVPAYLLDLMSGHGKSGSTGPKSRTVETRTQSLQTTTTKQMSHIGIQKGKNKLPEIGPCNSSTVSSHQNNNSILPAGSITKTEAQTEQEVGMTSQIKKVDDAIIDALWEEYQGPCNSISNSLVDLTNIN